MSESPPQQKEGGEDHETMVKELVAAIAEERLKPKEAEKMNIAFWCELYRRYFLEHAHEGDDLLFFVLADCDKTEEPLILYRRGALTRPPPPLGAPHVNWMETVYLNLILQYFSFELTVAVCNKDPLTQKLKILRKITETVFASPSQRRMDVKGSQDSITYPLIFFNIDNFDEVFEAFAIGLDQSVCVELVATVNKVPGVVFSGAVTHAALAAAYNNRATGEKWMSLKTKVERKMEFLHMRGPKGVGKAQMAISIFSEEDSSSSSSGPSRSLGGSFRRLMKSISSGALRSANDTSKDANLYPLSAFLTFISLSWETLMEQYFSPTRLKPVLSVGP